MGKNRSIIFSVNKVKKNAIQFYNFFSLFIKWGLVHEARIWVTLKKKHIKYYKLPEAIEKAEIHLFNSFNSK